MRLTLLSQAHRTLFNRYLKLKKHELSVYDFSNIYPWRGLFKIRWAEIDKHLCVFFEDAFGIFLYLPPLSSVPRKNVVEEAFAFMHARNKHKAIARIENVEESEARWFKDAQFYCRSKFPEYLYERKALVELSGNKYKSKRSAYNYFIKHYAFEYFPYERKYKDHCLKLYRRWMRSRQQLSEDDVYQGMMRDSLVCLEELLSAGPGLKVTGRLVKVAGELRAFTFGFALSEDTFCIQFEVTDLDCKGLSQFIFRQFCAELKEFTYINCMDDSGLENLKKVKQSYYPSRLIRAYIVSKTNE